MRRGDRRLLLHLSDLHLNARNETWYGIDAGASLRAVLESCAELDNIAAVIVTGDISDDGSEPAYVRARELLLGYARPRGAHVMFCVGNHDDRAAFARVLGTGYFDADGTNCGEPTPVDDRVGAVSEVAGLRVVTLDSLVPGRWYGSLGREQVTWLQEVIKAHPTPVVLALHHPPVNLGVEIQERVGLEDRASLAGVLEDGSVTAILCGHFHQQIAGFLSGVPTWVTPGVFTRIDHLSGPVGTERAVAGGSATVIDVTDPMSPIFAVAARA